MHTYKVGFVLKHSIRFSLTPYHTYKVGFVLKNSISFSLTPYHTYKVGFGVCSCGREYAPVVCLYVPRY